MNGYVWVCKSGQVENWKNINCKCGKLVRWEIGKMQKCKCGHVFNFPLVDIFIPIYTITYPYVPIHSNIYHSYSGLDSFGVLHTFEGGFL